MYFDDDTIDALLKLQALDLDLLKMRKQFEALPQRQQILEARQKKAAIQQKLDQVLAMKADIDKKLNKVVTEDEILANKQQEVQRAIEEAGRDYRNLEMRTKELEGHAKRRAVLAEQLADLDGQLAKVAEVENQVKGMITQIEAKEQKLIESFRSEGGELQQKMAQLEKNRNAMMEGIDQEAIDLYQKTANACAGVAVGELKNSACGVCRTPFDETRLVNVRSQAPLSRCPHCKRLLVVR